MREEDSVVAQRPLQAPTKSSKGLFLFCVALPQGLHAVQDFANDPQRWSKPYVYVCLAAAIYSSAWLVLRLASRPAGSTHRLLPNPLVLLLACFIWARFHGEIDPFLAFAAQNISAFVEQTLTPGLSPSRRTAALSKFEPKRAVCNRTVARRSRVG